MVDLALKTNYLPVVCVYNRLFAAFNRTRAKTFFAHWFASVTFSKKKKERNRFNRLCVLIADGCGSEN